jgi:hypothetical protein
MPPKRKPAKPIGAGVPRPPRVAKAKAKATIKKATASSHAPRARLASQARNETTSRTASAEPLISGAESLSPQPSSIASEGLEWQGLPAESSILRGSFMEEIRTMVKGSVAEAMAAGRGSRMEGVTYPLTGIVPPTSSAALTSPLAMPQHVLSRWPWVTEDTIKSIALGTFEIDNLPKLHRSDDLRNAYIKRSVKGILQPLDGGPPEIIVGTSKLHSSFATPTTFFLAWIWEHV